MNKLTSRNGIAPGDTVIYTGASKLYPRQNGLAAGTLRQNTLYEVEFVFPGDTFEQIELKDYPDYLFVHDMFVKVPPRKK